MLTPQAKLRSVIGETLSTRAKFSSRVAGVWLLCHAHDINEFTAEILVKSLWMSPGTADSVIWDLMEEEVVQRVVENGEPTKNKFELVPSVRSRALAEAQQ
jgi:hypothetical protein